MFAYVIYNSRQSVCDILLQRVGQNTCFWLHQ